MLHSYVTEFISLTVNLNIVNSLCFTIVIFFPLIVQTTTGTGINHHDVQQPMPTYLDMNSTITDTTPSATASSRLYASRSWANVCEGRTKSSGPKAKVMAPACSIPGTNAQTGKLEHRCSLCPYKSIFKSNMDKHLKTHSGEKPFACTVCNYKTIQKSNLTAHMLRHFNATTESASYMS